MREWSPWARGFAVSIVASASVYILNLTLGETGPATWWGFAYGAAATVLMVAAALYGLRRRTRAFVSRHGLGTTHSWLQFHVYGAALALLFMLMHTGFRLPSGTVNFWLWVLTLWVTISGMAGVLLQKWIPRTLSSGLTTEVIYERIPELTQQLSRRAAGLADTCEAPVRNYFEDRISPLLSKPKSRLIYFLDITGGIRSQLNDFQFLKEILSPEERLRVDELEGLYKTKLELDAHYTLQGALRSWLVVHVPPSVVLMMLLGWHLFSAWYY